MYSFTAANVSVLDCGLTSFSWRYPGLSEDGPYCPRTASWGVSGRIARQPTARDEDRLVRSRYSKRHQQNESGAALERTVVEEHRPVGDEFTGHDDPAIFDGGGIPRPAVKHERRQRGALRKPGPQRSILGRAAHLPVAEQDPECDERERRQERKGSKSEAESHTMVEQIVKP